jgi:hypothetical protein
VGEGYEKAKVTGSEYDQSTLHIYYENNIISPKKVKITEIFSINSLIPIPGRKQ